MNRICVVVPRLPFAGGIAEKVLVEQGIVFRILFDLRDHQLQVIHSLGLQNAPVEQQILIHNTALSY